MGKVKSNLRLIVQFAFAAVTNGYAKGFARGEIFTGKSKMFCVPGLNCYSCPGALFSCPLGALQATVNFPDYKVAFYVLGLLMFFGALLGRFVCGWLCPFGLVQDLLYKIPFFKKIRRVPGEKGLRFLRYLILLVFVLILPMFAVDMFGYGEPWFCKYICPQGTLEASVPLLIANEGLRFGLGFLYKWKVAILVVIVLSSVVIYRPFCRYLCPLGAIYGLFNPVSLTRFKVDSDKCDKCGGCQAACKLDIPVYEKPNSLDCIRCNDCMKACPHNCIGYAVGVKGKRDSKRAKAAEAENAK